MADNTFEILADGLRAVIGTKVAEEAAKLTAELQAENAKLRQEAAERERIALQGLTAGTMDRYLDHYRDENAKFRRHIALLEAVRDEAEKLVYMTDDKGDYPTRDAIIKACDAVYKEFPDPRYEAHMKFVREHLKGFMAKEPGIAATLRKLGLITVEVAK